MKRQILLLAAFFGLTAGTFAQNADVQIIHNCGDPAAAQVDIYVNGAITLDDFGFRQATDFISLPAGTYSVAVAPGTSSSVADALATFNLTLASGERYVVAATGVLDTTAFAVNPDGISRSFNLQILQGISATANPGETKIVALHGATDAPTVDVVPISTGTPLIDDVTFNMFSSEVSVPAASYVLNVTPGNDNSTVVASYTADLTTLGGGVAVVMASGFLDPASNQSGEAFGLFAVLADGTVLPLPAATTAKLQVIHNAADPAADSVDVYIDGTIALDDFAFRTATSFIDVNAGVTVNIGIAPSSSSSAADTIVNIPVTFAAGQTYVAIANGVLSPNSFAANPDGRNTGFQLLVKSGVRTLGTNQNNVDFFAVHGATDAPTVDVKVQGSPAPLVDNAAYTDITNYLSVPAASYVLNITPGNSNTIVASYLADLGLFGGGSAVVFASGFLDPSTNNNGPAFGLYVAFADGSVAALPAATTARVQIIHNSADPAADSVDVYVDGTNTFDDFGFRTATGFLTLPAGVDINVGIAPGTSASAADTLVNFIFNLTAGETYVVVANGVLNPANFAANPDAVSTAFNLYAHAGAVESASTSTNVSLLAFHGATDAPTVDVVVGGSPLIDNLAYTDFQGNAEVPAADYVLNVTPGNDNNTIVASFNAPLTALGGGSAVVFASGFLDPATNQNGAAFGLFAALTDGTVIPLANVTSIDEASTINGNIYPNPVTSELNVPVRNANSVSEIVVSDLTGRVVYNAAVSNQSVVKINTSSLNAGIYNCTVRTGNSVENRQFVVMN